VASEHQSSTNSPNLAIERAEGAQEDPQARWRKTDTAPAPVANSGSEPASGNPHPAAPPTINKEQAGPEHHQAHSTHTLPGQCDLETGVTGITSRLLDSCPFAALGSAGRTGEHDLRQPVMLSITLFQTAPNQVLW